MKKYHLGYTQGVYDMFHVGHLNLIKKASEQCERLLVGINSDELVKKYKHKEPVVSQINRLVIVESLKYVDMCYVVDTLDKVRVWEKLHFDAIFIGDDWKGDLRWKKTKDDLESLGVDTVFLPYTKDISSTILRSKVLDRISEY